MEREDGTPIDEPTDIEEALKQAHIRAARAHAPAFVGPVDTTREPDAEYMRAAMGIATDQHFRGLLEFAHPELRQQFLAQRDRIDQLADALRATQATLSSHERRDDNVRDYWAGQSEKLMQQVVSTRVAKAALKQQMWQLRVDCNKRLTDATERCETAIGQVFNDWLIRAAMHSKTREVLGELPIGEMIHAVRRAI